jgi:hypothetical protein
MKKKVTTPKNTPKPRRKRTKRPARGSTSETTENDFTKKPELGKSMMESRLYFATEAELTLVGVVDEIRKILPRYRGDEKALYEALMDMASGWEARLDEL